MKRIKQIFTGATILIMIFLSIGSVQAQNNTLQFNGSTDFITIGNINLPITTELTVMAWVRWDINPSDGNQWANMITCNANNSGDYGRFWFQHNSNNRKFEFAIQTTSGRRFVYSKTKPEQGVWYHIAATYDGSKIKLYVNDILERKKNHTGTIIPHEDRFYTSIGQWASSSNNNRRFEGTIDKVSIWNTALDEFDINVYECDEIDDLNPGLVAYWKMNEASGSDLLDASSNSFDGTINGAIRILNDVESCDPLPIDLATFTGDFENNSVVLDWSTYSEINNSHFVIEHSLNGIDYKEIANIQGSGNSSQILYYKFVDTQAIEGYNYYRLKQNDFNGQSETFEPISVYVPKLIKGDIVDFEVFPNPISQGAPLSINIRNIGDNESASVRLSNLSGRILFSDILKKDINNYSHQIENLELGQYVLNITTEKNTFKMIIIVR